jgi:hypothetical protein
MPARENYYQFNKHAWKRTKNSFNSKLMPARENYYQFNKHAWKRTKNSFNRKFDGRARENYTSYQFNKHAWEEQTILFTVNWWPRVKTTISLRSTLENEQKILLTENLMAARVKTTHLISLTSTLEKNKQFFLQ